jgi:hypothetical protein
MDSPVRKLVKAMAGHVKALREVANNSPRLESVYDNLCDVLDDLNKELKDEDEGMLPSDWKKFSTMSKT